MVIAARAMQERTEIIASKIACCDHMSIMLTAGKYLKLLAMCGAAVCCELITATMTRWLASCGWQVIFLLAIIGTMSDSECKRQCNASLTKGSANIFVTHQQSSDDFCGVTWFLYCSLLLLVLGQPATVFAQEQSVNPGINRHYQGAAHEDWVPVFETESREIYAKRYEILRALNIKPGTRVADIGAGTGFFSLLFASQTGPRGVVYAVDITDDFIQAIKARAAGSGIENLVGIVNDGRVSGLAPQSIDLAFICDTYHHFEYPRDTMQSVYRALSDTGEVVIIDFRKDPRIGSAWVQNHVRAGRDSVIQEMQDYGFELVETLPLLRTNYFLRFRKQKD